jgi:predicted regulator of Ras-like GTPase activity (Roadblock/LC7/MglB family)
MSRAEQITKLIKTLSTTTPDVEAAAVIDNDGLVSPARCRPTWTTTPSRR